MRLKERTVHRIFTISVFFKGLDAILEIVSGTLLLFAGNFADIVSSLVREELIESPSNVLATRIQDLLPYLTGRIQLFGSLYLLSHGIVKIFLVLGLLRRKYWAYPAAMAVLLVFIVYQLLQWMYDRSPMLIALSVLDAFIILLTWREYRLIKDEYARASL